MEIRHRVFVQQPNGIVTIADGDRVVSFNTVAEFLASEPAHTLPEGVIGVNAEWRGAHNIFVDTFADGSVKIIDNEQRVSIYFGYTEKLDIYESDNAAAAAAVIAAKPLDERRKLAYDLAGLTANRVAIALFKSQAYGDDTALIAYKAERDVFRNSESYPVV
jgi:hypothetical protein